jgi:hypothetical protein
MTAESAIELPIAGCDLSVLVGRDGTWLHFETAAGKSAAICIELMERGDGIIGAALKTWCAERQKQAEQIRADNGQFGVGAAS